MLTFVGRASILGLVALALLLTAAGLFAYVSTRDVTRTRQLVEHTYEVIDETRQMLSALQDAETGQRGFLIAGDERYLGPYEDALRRLPGIEARLAALTGDNGAQQSRLGQIRLLARDKLDELAATIDLARRSGSGAAEEVVRGDRGRALMERIRGLVAEMVEAEQDLLRARLDRTRAATTASMAAIVAVSLLSLLTLLGAALVVRRGLAGERAARAAAAAQATLLRTTVESLSQGIAAFDAEARLVTWNRCFADQFALPPDLARHGALYADVQAWLGRGEASAVLESPAEIAALAASGRPQSIVAFERRLHDGRSFEIRRTGLPDGGFVVTTTDKTAEVQAETMMRHAQRMEALGQLTGGIAHDFNNLLQVMISNLDLVAERLAEDRTLGRRIAAALRAAERGAAMTQQLLAFARRQPLAPVALDLDRVLAEVRELLHRSLGEAVDLQIVQSAGLWPAMADPAQLENVLVNLIVNARDAMPKGGKVTLETANVFLDEDDARQQDIAPGAYVMLAVTDTGEGMTAEVAARAFEPFFTTKEAGRGTGLGLSQVFGFIKQSGGHVKIDSEPGQGTSVKIYLPRAAAATAAGRVAGPSSLPSGTEAVLVVEDDEDVRAATAAQLQKLGYRTLVAGTAAEALAIIERGETIDLLFTDVVLPGGMRGGELAAEARRIRPAIAVLFTSGYTQNSIVHDGVLDPGALLLGKPYRLEALAAKLREALARAEGPVDTRPL